MLSVIYLSMLQHELVFFLLHGNFTESLSVGVVMRQTEVVSANLTAFTMRQKVLTLSSMIICTAVLSHSLLRIA